MKKWFKKRMTEKSTWAGLGALVSGFGMVLKANGMPEVGATVTQHAGDLSDGNYTLPLMAVLSGLTAMFAADKGNK